ncbi:uncharacterized protein LOC144948676 isoform X1 [Lampetra fluviatilis]
MVIRVFTAALAGSAVIKKKQQDVVGFLESNRIAYEELDIAMNDINRQWMRENVPGARRPIAGNPLPPQIFNEEAYCGDYEAFFNAKENEAILTFLGIAPPPQEKAEVEEAAVEGTLEEPQAEDHEEVEELPANEEEAEEEPAEGDSQGEVTPEAPRPVLRVDPAPARASRSARKGDSKAMWSALLKALPQVTQSQPAAPLHVHTPHAHVQPACTSMHSAASTQSAPPPPPPPSHFSFPDLHSRARRATLVRRQRTGHTDGGLHAARRVWRCLPVP